jgi:prolipoprotein diacylglyceryltransferase
MTQIISLLVLIIAIWYTFKVRSQAKAGQAVDDLHGGEKAYVWISSLLNPIFSGAFFYYGWKKLLPVKAKKANAISLWAFLIEVILGILYAVLFYHGQS